MSSLNVVRKSEKLNLKLFMPNVFDDEFGKFKNVLNSWIREDVFQKFAIRRFG